MPNTHWDPDLLHNKFENCFIIINAVGTHGKWIITQ